jgi:hypothetical protein
VVVKSPYHAVAWSSIRRGFVGVCNFLAFNVSIVDFYAAADEVFV